MSTIRIAFLHLAPCLRDLQANRRLIDRAVTTAASSLVMQDDQRLCSFTSERSAMFLIAWDLETQTCVMAEHQRVDL